MVAGSSPARLTIQPFNEPGGPNRPAESAISYLLASCALPHFWPLQQDVSLQQSAANKLVPKTNIKVAAVNWMGLVANNHAV